MAGAARAAGAVLRLPEGWTRDLPPTTARVRFAGRLAAGSNPLVSSQRLAVAAGAYIRALPGVGSSLVGAHGGPVVPRSASGAAPSFVFVEFDLPVELLGCVLGPRDTHGHVTLPAPWGGRAALSAAGEARTARKLLHLFGVPDCMGDGAMLSQLLSQGLRAAGAGAGGPPQPLPPL